MPDYICCIWWLSSSGYSIYSSTNPGGVRVFIADHGFNYTPGSCLLKVKSSLKAIQSLASAHRSSFSLPVIGITGSNGKTIVKEWLAQLLSTELDICKSPKSFNSPDWRSAFCASAQKKNHQAGVFEAGISKYGKWITWLWMILDILTNIGDAHDEGFISRQQKLEEKKLNSSTLLHFFYCGDQNLPDTPLLNWIQLLLPGVHLRNCRYKS